jgi:hypothetical protein
MYDNCLVDSRRGEYVLSVSCYLTAPFAGACSRYLARS